MTYSERSTQLALDSSVAVYILMGTAPGDAEFVPLLPRPATQRMWEEMRARWPGRGLRPIGVIGLVGTTPKVVLREPLEPEQVDALAGAFLAYLDVLFRDSFAAHSEVAEIAELERLFLLPDTRLN